MSETSESVPSSASSTVNGSLVDRDKDRIRKDLTGKRHPSLQELAMATMRWVLHP
jgi:hypothetical protein